MFLHKCILVCVLLYIACMKEINYVMLHTFHVFKYIYAFLPFFEQKVLESECVDTQSKAMAKLSVSQLSRLLNFALQRMKHQGVGTNLYIVIYFNIFIFIDIQMCTSKILSILMRG